MDHIFFLLLKEIKVNTLLLFSDSVLRWESNQVVVSLVIVKAVYVNVQLLNWNSSNFIEDFHCLLLL